MKSEYQRLLAVNRFKSVSAGVNHDLNSLVELIAQLCEAPIALVTIIDEHTQWFKAKHGIADIECNERVLSFCNATVAQHRLLIVPDARQDERFKNLPIVAHDPYIRFYAGVPLTTYDGHNVGTICVLDTVSRQLTAVQQNTLIIMARQVVNLLELNWSLQTIATQYEEAERQRIEAEQLNVKLDAAYNSSKDIQILLGKNFEVLAFNTAAAKHIFNYYKEELQSGRSILSYVNPVSARRLMIYFNSALSGVTHQTDWNFQLNGEARCMDVCFTPVYNSQQEIMGVAVNAADVTLAKVHARQVDLQNEALQRIATIQSHELRKPVASLMGIVDLIKDEPANSQYITMLSSAIDELDYKIRTIVKDAESTIYGHRPAS